MGSKRGKKLSGAVALALAIALLLAGCTGNNGSNGNEGNEGQASGSPQSSQTGDTAVEQPKELLEYSFYSATDAPQSYFGNPSDVITPYVEQKFNIKVKEVMNNQGQSFKQRFNLFIAADNLPDVISANQTDAVTVASSGRYAEVGELIKEHMPNLLKYLPEEDWKDALYQGRMYSVPSPFINVGEEQYKDDLYSVPMQNWSWVTRESILKQLGYTFKPLSQIKQEINDTGKKPTAEDFRIEPEIKTPEDFYNFLLKVKELGLKSGERDVIPLTIPHALQIHLGAMFGVTNAWQFKESNGDVTGWLGSDNAKEYYRFLNKLYKDGLLDKDFSIQKPEQLQEKIASGRAAAFMWIPDLNAARTSLKALDPQDELRPMFMPLKEGVEYAGIDHMSPTSFQLFVNKDFKDIPRLLEYFDWFLSDEALELSVWGPEELGLWEMKDGVKVFKDPALYESLSKGESEKGTPAFDDYTNKGLGNNSTAFRTALTLNGYSPADWRRSYPFEINDEWIYIYANAFATNPNIDFKGLLSQGVDEMTNKVGTWWFGEFSESKSPKLFMARSDEEFNKNWDSLYEEFLQKTGYEEARNEMKNVFAIRGLGK